MLQIAIDGPSGAGKSTLARAIAKKLKAVYVDTGAMYRALAYKATLANVSLDDEATLAQMLKNSVIALEYDKNGVQQIFLDGKNISAQIRDAKISQATSLISRWSSVRQTMVSLQQSIAKTQNIVMDGRDIGTVVLPNATFKFFVTADGKSRAIRRMNQWKKSGIEVTDSLEEVIAEIEQRDFQDRTREISPLCVAPGAHIIDTTHQTLEQSIAEMLLIIQNR